MPGLQVEATSEPGCFDLPAKLESNTGANTLKDGTHSNQQNANRTILETATGDFVGKAKYLMLSILW